MTYSELLLLIKGRITDKEIPVGDLADRLYCSRISLWRWLENKVTVPADVLMDLLREVGLGIQIVETDLDPAAPPVSLEDGGREFIQKTLSDAEKWGQLAEEAAELSQAALKMQRLYLGHNKPRKTAHACRDAVIEEHADVDLCLEVLGWSDKRQRYEIMKRKQKRWAENLAAELQRL